MLTKQDIRKEREARNELRRTEALRLQQILTAPRSRHLSHPPFRRENMGASAVTVVQKAVPQQTESTLPVRPAPSFSGGMIAKEAQNAHDGRRRRRDHTRDFRGPQRLKHAGDVKNAAFSPS